jgi:hypothetical protein
VGKPWIVDHELWKLIEPVLPLWPTKASGPKPVSDQLYLQGILFVLHTGIGWGRPPAGTRFRAGNDLLAPAGTLDQRGRPRSVASNTPGQKVCRNRLLAGQPRGKPTRITP